MVQITEWFFKHASRLNTDSTCSSRCVFLRRLPTPSPPTSPRLGHQLHRTTTRHLRSRQLARTQTLQISRRMFHVSTLRWAQDDSHEQLRLHVVPWHIFAWKVLQLYFYCAQSCILVQFWALNAKNSSEISKKSASSDFLQAKFCPTNSALSSAQQRPIWVLLAELVSLRCHHRFLNFCVTRGVRAIDLLY